MSTFMEEIAHGYVFVLLLIIPRVNNIIHTMTTSASACQVYDNKNVILLSTFCNACYNIDKKIKYINQSHMQLCCRFTADAYHQLHIPMLSV